MAQTIACLRCGKLVPVVILDETMSAVSEELTADVRGGQGMLTTICADCMTSAESVQLLRQSTVAMLDAAEDGLAGLDMIFERLPHAKDNPKFKETYAHYQAEAERARNILADLMNIDETDDE